MEKNALFLNLPNKNRVMRRYMCSYNSPTFLFQPIELLSLAAIAEKQNYRAKLVDAIAESLSSAQVTTIIREKNPDFIVCLSGFECIEEDLQEMEAIKSQFPSIPLLLFGHYAGIFKQEIMEKTSLDFVIDGEPDLVFQDWLLALASGQEFGELEGLSFRRSGEIFHTPSKGRIINPNELPDPAFHLLQNEHYAEPFFPKPYGLLQSARGCPYQCNFCVKSYGTKLTSLTPERMIQQLETYIQLHHIQSYRFIDDTFTAVPSRVIEFCKLLIEKNILLPWSCLCRPDTLQPEMLDWMKKAGCKRLYIGVESGSQKIIRFLNKKFEVKEAEKNIRIAHQKGFELMGFFMVGYPIETKDDMQQSLRFAIRSGMSFIVVSAITPYPGTALYDQLSQSIQFQLLPYQNEFKDPELRKQARAFQSKFIRKFYLHPIIWWRISNHFFAHSLDFLQNTFSLLGYLFTKNKKIKRKDYI